MAWLSYTLFTLYSGSRGVVITDTLMFLLFTVMSFVALFYIVDVHDGWLAGLDGLVRSWKEKPDLMTWHGVVGARYGVGYPGRLRDLVCHHRHRLEPGCRGQPLAIEPLPDGEERTRGDPLGLHRR